MSEERKATDVLLSIEQTVGEILEHLRNQDMLLKNIANRIGKNNSIQQPLPQKEEPIVFKNADEPTSNSSVKKLPGLKNGVFVNANQVGGVAQTDFTKELNQLNGKRKDSKQIVPNKINQHIVVPVQQKVTFADGKPITMAFVELFVNDNGNLVSYKKLKTNATGKWTLNLPAGEYVVKVFKNRNFNNEEVRIETAIVVPQSNESVQLETIQAKV